jgi:aspartate/methionine/tyrosine aminotransferase
MFAPTRYLDWARRFYGQVRFDLATSGIPAVGSSKLRVDAATTDDDPLATWSRLREAIARYNDVPCDDVFPALGTTHALWLACASLTSPGDDVLVEEPVYEPLIRIAEGVGARVVHFARDPRAGFALDPDRIERAMTPRTRLIVVTNLHNPSGVRASDDAVREVASVAAARGAVLLVDEVYSAFDALVDDRGVFRKSARKLAENVVAVSSLTKCYGLGLERIGWLLGPRDVVASAGDALTANAGMLPCCHARAGLAAFSQILPLAERARGLLGAKRERVAAWIAAHDLSWSAPAEGLFGWVTLPGRGDLTPAIEAAARDREVLVAAGAFFGVPNAFRIAWSLPAAQLDEGLGRLAEALGC